MAIKPTTVPRWAETTGGVAASNIAAPTSGQQDTGYTANQVPTSGVLNWILRFLYDWTLYLRDGAFTSTVGSGLPAVTGTGDGNSAGAHFQGGAAGGDGVSGSATGTATFGVVGNGSGTGAGVQGRGGSSGPGGQFFPANIAVPVAGNINLVPLSAVPSAPSDGDVWVEQGQWACKARMGGSVHVLQANARVTPAYSASITIDPANLGSEFVITATNSTAFTINAPNSALTGKRITIRIRNTSGGALGVLTWNAAFKMSAWTQPATGNSRAIDFQYDGTNWVEASRTPADVPN